MTAILDKPAAASPVVDHRADVPRRHRMVRSPVSWLAAILTVQVGLALRPGTNGRAFEDEGLYVYFGHLFIERLMTGVHVARAPGSYFSGSPWLYPPLAALGDDLGGLQGARAVSLFFALVATVGTYGLSRELFGARAGIIAAAAFALNGSVIFLSHFATYDSMAMGLVALAAWLAALVVRRGAPIWLPLVAGLLVLAFLTKYAAAVYAPIVGLIALAAGWPSQRWKSVRRGAFVVILTGLIAWWVVATWGRDLVAGLVLTTVDRHILIPTGHGELIKEVFLWVGPWLVLAAVPLLFFRDQWRINAVLLLGSIVGPLEQIRIGEQVSLSKHVGFGLVFACPLIGELFSWMASRARWVTWALLAVTLVNFTVLGLHYSTQFLTSWPDDSKLTPVLVRDIAPLGDRPVLGEDPAPERYELRNVTTPDMWYDTSYFRYGGKAGVTAYTDAVDQSWFGLIYLDGVTGAGAYLQTYLATHDTPYVATAVIPRVIEGRGAGDWTVYTLKNGKLPTPLKGPS